MDHDQNQESNAGDRSAAATSEPVRSRWTPKPEQIQILENIFNSGTVNPAKDETIKIRKILEQYGSVGDANVFYWFQNRRSRSRRRLRQMQAAAAVAAGAAAYGHGTSGAGAVIFEPTSSSSSSCNSSCSGFFSYSTSVTSSSSSSPGFLADDHSSYGEDLFSTSRQIGGYLDCGQNPYMYFSDASQLQYQQSGIITVFINGIPSEVPRGAFDMKAMFGQDVVLVHSSGELLPANEYGYLLQGLQMGESYFLVSRPT